jgi:hypothetical protein
LIKGVVDTRVKLVEGTAAVFREEGIVGDWLGSGCAEGA